MASTLPDGWIERLNTHINRLESPLGTLSPNKLTDSPANGKLLSPLGKAKQVVNTLNEAHDPKIVTLSFRYLYLRAKNNNESRDVIKSHQRYIVQLSSRQHTILCRQELSTLCAVLANKRRFKGLKWTELLNHDFTVDKPMNAVLVSYYFFVIQGILQDISQNLHTLTNELLPVKISILWDVALTFLSNSGFSRALDEVESHSRTKYLRNKLKMLSGFLKITKFLLNKKKTDFLEVCFQAFDFKLKETDGVPLARLFQDVNRDSYSHKLEPFIEDYKNRLPLADYCENTSKFDISSSERVQTPTELSSLKLERTEATAELQTQEIKFYSQQIQAKVLDFAMRIRSRLVDLDLVAEISSLIKTYNKDDTAYEEIFSKIIPLMIPQLKTQVLFDSIRQLSRVCFELGNNASSAEALQAAAKLDLIMLSLVPSGRLTARLQKRLEYSIWKMLLLYGVESTREYIMEYLESADHVEITESFAQMASEVLLKEDHLALFFGVSLYLDHSQQVSLIKALHPFLSNNATLRDVSIKQIIQGMDKKLSSADMYQVARLFGCSFEISKNSKNEEDESLYLAGIKTESLLHKTPHMRNLKEIEKLLCSWIETSTQSTNSDQSVCIFLHIVEQLQLMGFYLLCESILEAFFSRGSSNNLRADFDLNLLHCRCKLALNDLDAIPPILTTAGSSLKKMGTDLVTPVDIMKWKLLQLEYFSKVRDEERLAIKLEEVGKFLASRPEFDLKSESAITSFEERLSCVIMLARYLLLVSQFWFQKCNFSQAIVHGKFSLKLIKSVIRASDCLTSLLLDSTNDLLYRCLREEYLYHRRVGISKEALVFLKDLQEINLRMSPLRMASGHFDQVAHFIYMGRDSVGSKEFSEGKQLIESTDFKLLEVSMALASTASITLKEEEPAVINHALEMLKSFEYRSVDICTPLSLSEVENLYVNLGLICSSPVFIGAPEMNVLALRNREFMQMKALSTLKSELLVITRYLKPSILVADMRNISKVPKVSHQFYERLKEKLLECLNCLLQMTTELFFRGFEISQQQELTHMNRVCRMLMFKMDMNERFNCETEIASLLTLEDEPQSIPYSTQILIHNEKAILFPCFHSSVKSSTFKQVPPHELYKVIPENWAVVSLDICSVTGDLMVTRHLSLGVPLALNIPVDRLKDGTRFEDLLKALAHIIDESNKSTKSETTSQVKTKEDRMNWWRIRFDLDLRLQELLQNVEDNLLGGLRGILGPSVLGDANFKLFSDSLNSIWSQVFPQLDESWKLSRRICEIYYNINPFDKERGFCKRLLIDLTEFCVEHLGIEHKQQAIERAVEMLRSLYIEPKDKPDRHLVLIVSDKCSQIPWESINYLRGTSVTRMPNMRCLYDLLTLYSPEMKVRREKKHNISYVINPGRDLTRTQNKFEPVFMDLNGATGVCGQTPTEEKLVSLILSSDVYVYMGHGGGEQYLRLTSVTSASAESLPPALLLGCSSCAFEHNGRMPASSNVYNWLVRGSPAVVATLWDVTDKDIDSFTLSMLEEWGMVRGNREEKSENLSNAVSLSRDRCILKYLNGSAPIVYGLPLQYK